MPTNEPDERLMSRSNSSERAVSPVIGVILMVAITVVLAAVIGVFVLGLGDEIGSTSPSVMLDFEPVDNETIELVHSGGDTLDLDSGDYSVLVEGSTDDGATFVASTLSAGESTDVNLDSGADAGADAEVQIRHDPSGSIIASGEVDIE